MSHVNYLSRVPVEQPMIYHPEKPTEETFVGQICISRKAKYAMTFIYNIYGSWMSVKIDRRKEMYGLCHKKLSNKFIKLKNEIKNFLVHIFKIF